MNIEKLKSLANTDLSKLNPNENTIKYKIVIPFLECFGHEPTELEHAAQGSRIDVNIDNRIIVETKALGKNIDMYHQQISDYSGREIPVLAILTNGRHFRIFSPQWKHVKNFSEKIIYEFELKDLNNTDLLNQLEKILGYDNYINGDFADSVELREREIKEVKKEIDEVKKFGIGLVSDLRSEIIDLEEKLSNINEQIRTKKQKIANIESGDIPEINNKVKEFHLLFTKTQVPKQYFSKKESIKITKTPLSSKVIMPEPNSGYNGVRVKFKIEKPKIGVLAYGYVNKEGKFVVTKDSIISDKIAKNFRSSCPTQYKMRNDYEENQIIVDRKFVKDFIFNSKSSAAKVILGTSISGPDAWKVE